MSKKNKFTRESVYTSEIIEFAAIGVEYARLVEQGGSAHSFVRTTVALLPRLYAQMLVLPEYYYDAELDYIEEYVSEQSYELVRARIATILGEHDSYLSVYTPDDPYNDTPLITLISEQLADIYQHVGNLLGVLRSENEIALPSAIGRCLLYWREHWGQALLSALGALHQVYTKLEQEDDENDDTENHSEITLDDNDLWDDTDEIDNDDEH